MRDKPVAEQALSLLNDFHKILKWLHYSSVNRDKKQYFVLSITFLETFSNCVCLDLASTTDQLRLSHLPTLTYLLNGSINTLNTVLCLHIT
jgi:hypothetical protein